MPKRSVPSKSHTELPRSTAQPTRAEHIVALLREAPAGAYVSGQHIAAHLGVSRTIVSQEMRRLTEQGYAIESRTRSGYRLLDAPDILTCAELQALVDQVFGSDPHGPVPMAHSYATIDSTNLEAKRIAQALCGEHAAADLQTHAPHILLAQEQTAGRGRLGRSWVSPKRSGLYMSLLLFPRLSAHRAQALTLVVGVALCRALREATQLGVRIKWPNDLVVDDKKLCGILVETSLEGEQIASVVVGFGINTTLTELPAEIADTATSLALLGVKVSQIELIRYILKGLRTWIDAVQTGDALFDRQVEFATEEHRTLSSVLGRDIVMRRLHDEGEAVPATAVDLSADGELIVRLATGETEVVRSGEVQIRKRSAHAADI